MKFRYLILVVLLLAVSLAYQKNVTPEGETNVVVKQMGWPLQWLEVATTTEANATTTTYNVLWANLVIDVAVYTAIILLLLG